MHPEAIKRYVKRIAEVVDGATDGLGNPKPIPRPRTDGLKGYALLDEIHRKQQTIVDDLLKKDHWINKFSQDYLGSRISEIVSKNVGTSNNSGIELMFTKLTRDFADLKDPNTVLIPLEGIVLKVAELQLGKIRLVNATPEYLFAIREEAENVAGKTKGGKAAKAESLKHLNEMLDQFQGTVCAERVVVAESNRAREIAREELRLTVAMLNFLGEALAPQFHEIRVGLKGEFSRGLRIEMARGKSSFNWESKIIGPRAPLTINEKALEAMKELQIFELAELVTKEGFDSNETFEGTILTAIHFHAHARELPEATDKVLNLMTAIEQFFETSQKQIAASIANGCALVLCNTLEDRLKLKGLIKKLYKLRSSISHFGEKTVLKSDVAELSFISWQLISFAIQSRSDFKNKKEFNLWVEKLELGLENKLSIVTFRK